MGVNNAFASVFCLSAIILLSALCPLHAASSFQTIGNLGGSQYTVVDGISADGSTVVGQSRNAGGNFEAYYWTSGGGMTGLGDLAGGSFSSRSYGVSSDGSVIVGYGTNGSDQRAFRWTSAGGMVDLGVLPGASFSYSTSYGVSRDGVYTVGISSGVPFGTEAFYWTSGGGMVSIGDFPEPLTASQAYGISDDGSVIAGIGRVSAGNLAFRWTSAGGMVSLGTLGGTQSQALAISADGSVVVGHSDTASSSVHAFRWTSAGGMVDLGDLPGGLDLSYAFDISADGNIIVGRSYNGQGDRAVVWDPINGLQDLNVLLTQDYGLDLQGTSLIDTTAVTVSNGYVYLAGTGYNPSFQLVGWVVGLEINPSWGGGMQLLPEPSTYASMLVGMALLGAAIHRRRR